MLFETKAPDIVKGDKDCIKCGNSFYFMIPHFHCSTCEAFYCDPAAAIKNLVEENLKLKEKVKWLQGFVDIINQSEEVSK